MLNKSGDNGHPYFTPMRIGIPGSSCLMSSVIFASRLQYPNYSALTKLGGRLSCCMKTYHIFYLFIESYAFYRSINNRKAVLLVLMQRLMMVLSITH